MTPEDPIEFALTEEEKRFLVAHTLGDTGFLDRGVLSGASVVVRCSREELDDLLDFIAAEANHTDDPNIARRLDGLYDRLRGAIVSHNSRPDTDAS